MTGKKIWPPLSFFGLLSFGSFFIAGFASLALQIVSFKFISASGLSDAISVAISLTGFVSLSGLGALLAGRVTRQFTAGMLECALGLYALLIFGALYAVGIEHIITLFAGSSLGEKLILFMLATGPLALFSGMLIPLHQYRHGMFTLDPRRDDFTNFIPVYLIFHAGGALALLLIEMLGFPLMGWPLVGVILAVLSTLNGLYVIGSRRGTLQANNLTHNLTNNKGNIQARTLTYKKWHYLLPWLFLLSILTGFAGIVSYKMFDFLVGPNIRNYAVVTALIFLAFTFTSIIAHRIKLSFKGILSASGLGIMCLFVPIAVVPHLAIALLEPGFSHWLVYALAGVLLIVPAYTLIGLSVPSSVRLGVPSHHALFVVALGNALGYWLYIFTATYQADGVILAAGAFVLLILGSLKAWPAASVLAAGLAFAIFPHFHMATHHMVMAHRMITWEQQKINYRQSPKENQNQNQKNPQEQSIRWHFEVVKNWNTYGWPIDFIRMERYKNAQLDTLREYYMANGYQSLNFTQRTWTKMSESFVAGLPLLFVENKEEALVFGAGPGISAGFIGQHMRNTKVIDLSPDTPAILNYFNPFNHNAANILDIHQQDALSFVNKNQADSNRYDYIFSTVSGAGYAFSAMLYTQEFFKAAANIMKEQGIYAIWSDHLFGEGMDNIFKALEQVFPYTRTYQVRPTQSLEKVPYYVMIASRQPLSLKVDETSPVVKHLAQLQYEHYQDGYADEETPPTLQEMLAAREISIPRPADAQPTHIDRLKHAYDYLIFHQRIAQFMPTSLITE